MSNGQQYVRVVETSEVTDERLEEIINRMLDEGWLLDAIQFAMRDHSRRPSMAFLIFCSREGAEKMGTIAPKSFSEQ